MTINLHILVHILEIVVLGFLCGLVFFNFSEIKQYLSS